MKQYLLEHPDEDTCLGVLVAMITGIRIGELCALQWGDFDLERGNVMIKRNLQRIRNEGMQNGIMENKMTRTRVCVQLPKTASSIRLIPLADGLLDILRVYQKSPEQYLISGRKSDWVDIRTCSTAFLPF